MRFDNEKNTRMKVGSIMPLFFAQQNTFFEIEKKMFYIFQLIFSAIAEPNIIILYSLPTGIERNRKS